MDLHYQQVVTSDRYEALCAKLDELAGKWRPFAIGTSRLIIKVFAAENLEQPVEQREASIEEARKIAVTEMTPVVLAALLERMRLV